MTPFTAAIDSFGPLPPGARRSLDAIVRHRSARRGTALLAVGQVARSFYFIERGLARVYYVKNGKDVTDYFAMDAQFIGAVESLFTRAPSHKGMEALEDSSLWLVNYEAFERLCASSHRVLAAADRMLLFAFLEGQRRIEAIRFLSARERYAELERRHPGISNRAPLRHIASYLGITPVSLSRIRAGLQ